MGLGLKLFWGAILTFIIVGFIYLATIGLPSPAVEVRKKIDIQARLT